MRLINAWIDAMAAWLELAATRMREELASFDDSIYGRGYADAAHDFDDRRMALAEAEAHGEVARTHERLRDDPEYIALKAAADEEAATTPEVWWARNRLEVHVHARTPLFGWREKP